MDKGVKLLVELKLLVFVKKLEEIGKIKGVVLFFLKFVEFWFIFMFVTIFVLFEGLLPLFIFNSILVIIEILFFVSPEFFSLFFEKR